MTLKALNFISFFSAFLLFQIELIVAKILLPYYGGSYFVWGACVVFFQATLLLGYWLAHVAISKLGIRRYRYVHVLLLVLPLLTFPGRSLIPPHVHPQIPVVVDVFVQLMIGIGPVFLVLSMMSPVLQKWLASSVLPQKINPYRLFAVSNMGSFTALLTYPFLFEAVFDIPGQLNIWRMAYGLVVMLQLGILASVDVRDSDAGSQKRTAPRVAPEKIVTWLLAGASGVVLFLSVTNMLTAEVAPIPLLWIIPLCIYLLSFVLNFKEPCWCPLWISKHIGAITGFAVAVYFVVIQREFPFLFNLFLLSFVLFLLCMFCQNVLLREKPADEYLLTFFYVMISLGGFMGGMLVSWVIPRVSDFVVEYPLGILLLAAALMISSPRVRLNLYHLRLLIYLTAFLIFWPMAVRQADLPRVALFMLAATVIFRELSKNPLALSVALALLICFLPLLNSVWSDCIFLEQHRNHYGISKVFDKDGFRHFVHGTTLHGIQFLHPQLQKTPLTYFSTDTPVGKVLESEDFQFRHIGVMGLGTGTLAAYLKGNQRMDFFELDPDVFKLTDRYFTYAKFFPDQIGYVFGDARLSMKERPENYYDLLVVDVFGSDAVPVHILTLEAIEEYRRHLTADGVLLFHVTNRYIEMRPVLSKNASFLDAKMCWKENGDTGLSFRSLWVAMTWSQESYLKLTKSLLWSPAMPSGLRPWSDNYSNVLGVVKLRETFRRFREYRWISW